jgi:hypothetical protein
MSPRKLWLEFEGGVSAGAPVRARIQQPARGPRLRIRVEEHAAAGSHIFVLLRRGQGDLVVGASTRRESLEEAQRRLGTALYEIVSLPVVE